MKIIKENYTDLIFESRHLYVCDVGKLMTFSVIIESKNYNKIEC